METLINVVPICGHNMSYVRTKKRNGKTYYYLVEGKRVDGKVKQKVLKYLGTNPEMVNVKLSNEQVKSFAEAVFVEDISSSDELKTCLDQIGIPYPDQEIMELNLSRKIGGKKFNLFLYFAASEEV